MRSDFKYCKQMGRVKALPIVTSIIFIAALNFLLQIGHEQSYLRNLLTGLGYIGDDMECGIHHVGQLYRDSFINSPIVLETFGLVSGFGFEGYTWKQHNNGTNNEIVLMNGEGKAMEGGLDDGFHRSIKPTTGGMLFTNCIYELHWAVHSGHHKHTKENEAASAAEILLCVSPIGILYRSKDNAIVGQWLGCPHLPAEEYCPEYGSIITVGLYSDVLDNRDGDDDTQELAPFLTPFRRKNSGFSSSSNILIRFYSTDLGLTWITGEKGYPIMMKLRMPEDAAMFPMTKPVQNYMNKLRYTDKFESVSHEAVAPQNRLLDTFKVYEVVTKSGSHEPFILIVINPLSRKEKDPIRCEYKVENVKKPIILRGLLIDMSLVACSTYGMNVYLGRKMEVRIISREGPASQYAQFRHISPPSFTGLWLTANGYTIDTTTADHPKLSPPYRLAICTIIKDEGDNLKEWLEYHHTLGVEQFYIYDNTPDGQIDELQSSILRNWTAMGRMMNNRHMVEWMAFTDVDEYIDPTPEAPVSESRTWEHMKEKLKQPTELHDNITHPGIHCIPWVYYCAKDLIEEPTPFKGIRETYKAILDMSEQKRWRLRCPNPVRDENSIRLRHYRTKCRNSYVRKRMGHDVAYQNIHHKAQDVENEWNAFNRICRAEPDLMTPINGSSDKQT